MIPLVATGIAAIATITVGTILGFMIDGMELSITSKEITEIQNLKGVEFKSMRYIFTTMEELLLIL